MTQSIQPINFTVEERTKFSGTGMRALLKLEQALGLTETEMVKLLGKPGKTEYKEWRRAAAANETVVLPSDTLNRVRAAIIIVQSVSKRWPKKPERVTDWLRTQHNAPVFQKKSPLGLMSEQDISGIISVLRYVSTFNNAPDPTKASPKPVRRRKNQSV